MGNTSKVLKYRKSYVLGRVKVGVDACGCQANEEVSEVKVVFKSWSGWRKKEGRNEEAGRNHRYIPGRAASARWRASPRRQSESVRAESMPN